MHFNMSFYIQPLKHLFETIYLVFCIKSFNLKRMWKKLLRPISVEGHQQTSIHEGKVYYLKKNK